jgi:phage-related protein
MPVVIASVMNIEYWELNANHTPVLDFIEEQAEAAQAKIQKVTDFFEEQGMRLLNTQYMSKLKGVDLYELKIKWKGLAYRIFAVIKGSIAYLVHAFIKKTENTPMREIKLALARKSIIEKGN